MATKVYKSYVGGRFIVGDKSYTFDKSGFFETDDPKLQAELDFMVANNAHMIEVPPAAEVSKPQLRKPAEETK